MLNLSIKFIILSGTLDFPVILDERFVNIVYVNFSVLLTSFLRWIKTVFNFLVSCATILLLQHNRRAIFVELTVYSTQALVTFSYLERTHIYGEMRLKHTRNNEYFAKPLSKHNDFPLRHATRGLQYSISIVTCIIMPENTLCLWSKFCCSHIHRRAAWERAYIPYFVEEMHYRSLKKRVTWLTRKLRSNVRSILNRA